MTNDEILQAAKEAGCNVKTDGFITYRDEPVGNMLERFAAIIEKRTIERCAIPDNALQAIKDACSEAMHYTLAARIPECGNFGEIAQNLSFALQEIATIRKLGEQ